MSTSFFETINAPRVKAAGSQLYTVAANAGATGMQDIPAQDRAEIPQTPPPFNQSQVPLAMARIGWDVYQNYWSNAPSDIRAFLNLLYGWTNVVISTLARDYMRLPRKVWMTDTTNGQGEEEEFPFDSWASSLARHPWPGIDGPKKHAARKMRWMLSQPGGVFEFTPTWGTFDVVEQGKQVALLEHKKITGLIGEKEFERKRKEIENPEYGTLKPDWQGMPAAFHILESSRMWIVADAESLVRYYVYFSNSGPRYFAPWEICHITDPYPSDNPITHILWGSCPVERAWRAVGAANNIQSYISNFFSKFAMPAVLATKQRGFWTPEEKEEFETWWIKKHRLGGGGMGFAEDQGTKIEVVDTTKNQTKLYDVNKQAAEEICAHFGLNLKHILGDDQNRAQTHGHQEQYENGPLRAYADLIDEGESEHLSRFYDGIRIGIVPPPNDERSENRDEDAWLIANGVQTPNDIAKKRGIDAENPDGDTYFVNQNLKPMALVVTPPVPPGNAAPQKSFRPVKKLSAVEDDGNGYNKADDTYGTFKAFHDIAEKHKKNIEKKVSACYRELRGDILREIKKSIKSEISMLTLIDWDSFKNELAEATGSDVADLISDTIEASIKDGVAAGGDAEIDVQRIIDKAVDRSIDKITTSADTVKEELRALLQSMKDKTAGEVEDAIKNKFDQYEDSGAARIATTTTTYGQGNAAKATHKEMGVRSMWLELRIAKEPRATHLALHKQIADEYGMWHVEGVALAHPGDGPADQAINCHCVLKAVK